MSDAVVELPRMADRARVVELSGVGVHFGPHQALSEVDLVITEGERVAVLGASGSGKSTLLKLLNASLSPSAGEVRLLGQETVRMAVGRRRALQRRIGTISQDLDLIEHVRVVHNVNAGQLGRWSTGRALASLIWPRSVSQARHALTEVGLGWSLYSPTDALSGGERQRVAIARLLLQAPDLVLADEPVSSLDPTRAGEVLRLLTTRQLGEQQGADQAPLRRETDTTLVVSLHQPQLAQQFCSRAVGLREGRIVFDVPVAELDQAPLDQLYAIV